MHDPGSAAGAVTDDEIAPGRALQIFVALGRGERAPIFLRVRDFRFGEGGVEGIEPAIVRIDAEPELGNGRALSTRDGFEARLQPHRHEQDRRLIAQLLDRGARIADADEILQRLRGQTGKAIARLRGAAHGGLRGFAFLLQTPARGEVLAVVLIKDARQLRLFGGDAPEPFARGADVVRGRLALIARLP